MPCLEFDSMFGAAISIYGCVPVTPESRFGMNSRFGMDSIFGWTPYLEWTPCFGWTPYIECKTPYLEVYHETVVLPS